MILKPVIGFMPLMDIERESLWMLPAYLEGIREAGGLSVVLPLISDRDEILQLVGMCDGLLFTGGQDVEPRVYGEEPIDERLLGTCPARDAMELIALEAAIGEDKAILGICRGLQMINAALGGTLYQDLPTQHPSAIAHRQPKPYDAASHSVRILEGTPLTALLGEEAAVNSCHHQAIKDLAPSLSPMAVTPDGLTEAVYRPASRFVWAVQWHPEFFGTGHEGSRRIFSAFVRAAEQGRSAASGQR